MSEKIEKLLAGKGENYIFPFFWQHGESEEVLRKYMDVIDKSNIGAVCVESRPHPDFCGEKWWQDMDIILDEAKKRNMKVWILDDSHFPTGFANGAVEKEPVEMRRQSICCRVQDVTGGETVTVTEEQLKHPDPFQKTMVENFVMQGEIPVFDDDELLGIYAVRVDEGKNGFMDPAYRINLTPEQKAEDIHAAEAEAGELIWEVPEGTWKIYTMHLSRNFGYHRSYINMMNAKSCKILLDAVYEPHYAHYKEMFGSTIAGFFSDEPETGNGHIYEIEDKFGTMVDFPWSSDLFGVLSEEIGEENFWKLPLLWENGADVDLTANLRYTYMDAVTRLIQKNFSEQVGSWCREHGVEYIGHLIEDDDHHSRLGSSLGHYFRGLRGQDMAGIDDIGGQVLPGQENVCYNNGTFQHRNGMFYHYVLGKLASSAAAIEPHKHGDSMCEIFGNYGWEEGVQLEKYLADHFMVRGVNHYVPHAFTAKEFPDPDCPPHFYAHGNNPQYRHFGELMKYMNRICELITDGAHEVHTAILYDGEADWTGDVERSGKAAQILYDRQADYDIIPQDVFAEREFYHTQIADGQLVVNTQHYNTLIVTEYHYITEAFAKAVKEMTAAGVKVYFIGAKPEGICDVSADAADMGADVWKEAARQANMQMAADLEQAEVISYEKLADLAAEKLADTVTLTPSNERIRVTHYEYGDGSGMVYLVNEGDQIYEGTVTLAEAVRKPAGKERTLAGYDAWTNQLYPVYTEEGSNAVKVSLEPRKSIIWILDADSQAENDTPEIESTQKAAGEDRLAETVQQRIHKYSGTPETLADGWMRSTCRSIDYPNFGAGKEVPLPDHLEEEEPLFSGFIRYEKKVRIENPANAILKITDAAEGVELFLNGKSLGIQIVPSYVYDLSDAAVQGENELVIEVATTLEREMSTIPNRYGMPKDDPKCKSGICGEVRLYQ